MLTAGTALGLVTGAAQAQTAWTGNASADWLDSANWDNGVPNAAVNAVIDSNLAPNDPVVSGANASADYLTVGGSSTGMLTVGADGSLSTFAISAGLNVTGEGTLLVDSNGAIVSDRAYIGSNGLGNVSVVGGADVTVNTVAVLRTSSDRQGDPHGRLRR